MKPLIERLAMLAFLICGLYGAWKLADYAVERRDKRRAAREAKIVERGCIHTGYYGKSGDYRVYNCRGWIVKEEDL